MAKMRLLSDTEIKTFELPPVFNSYQRKRFFHRTAWMQDILEQFRKPTNKVGFILLCGYFKSTSRFFVTHKFYESDRDYVCNQLGIPLDQIQLENYTERTFIRHQETILDYFGFTRFRDTAKDQLVNEVKVLVSRQIKPRQVFLSLLDMLHRKKIVVPTYHALSEIIIQAIDEYENLLMEILNRRLTQKQKDLLESLYETEGEEALEEKKWQRYRFTMLKKINQSIQPIKIKENIRDLQILQPIYLELQEVIQALNLSANSIEYYATWAKKAQIFQLFQKDTEKRYLHSIAFVISQYFSLQEVLIDKLCLAVQKTLNAVHREYQQSLFAHRHDQLKNEKKLLEYAKHQKSFYSEVKEIIHRSDLTDEQKIVLIKEMMSDRKKPPPLADDDISSLESQHQKRSRDEQFYDELESLSLALQKKVAEIPKQIRFDEGNSNPTLISTIHYYKSHQPNLGKNSPSDFMEKQERKLIVDSDNRFRISLYKALLYQYTADAIKSGALNVKESHKYKALDEYLIEKKYWESHQDQILEEAELLEFKEVNQVLARLAQQLDQQFHKTNQHILEGSNPFLTFKDNGDFVLKTPKVEKEEESGLSEIFPKDEYVSLLEVLTVIEKYTGFLDPFEHYSVKYSKKRPSQVTFFAAIMAYGCNIGISKMAKISRGIDPYDLEKAVNWYLSVEGIHQAIDKILDFMSQLELPSLFRKNPDQLHTSSDGQKFNVAVDSLNANYSFKYFGKESGVSVSGFTDERDFYFHSTVHSPSDREAIHVIDGLMHNEVVQSDIHSTDTHGYTEAIFGIMYLLKIEFAPRIKGLRDLTLYSFERRKTYQNKGYKILPEGYIPTKLIKENWSDALRFVATIKLKKTTASQLFKRLNSYSKQHVLYKTLKAFGEINKTISILKDIDEVQRRQRTERMLNKIENSNKFSKAVVIENNQEFIQGTKEEQEIAEGCRRLIKTALICWNYLYLTEKVQREKDETQKQLLLDTIQNSSVVAWKHFNFHGEYDFSKQTVNNSDFSHIPKIG